MRATSSTAPAQASMFEGLSLAAEKMPAAKHIERQVAVTVVIAVEEPAFLMAVKRIVGGVEVEDDLIGRSVACASRNRSTNSAWVAAPLMG